MLKLLKALASAFEFKTEEKIILDTVFQDYEISTLITLDQINRRVVSYHHRADSMPTATVHLDQHTNYDYALTQVHDFTILNHALGKNVVFTFEGYLASISLPTNNNTSEEERIASLNEILSLLEETYIIFIDAQPISEERALGDEWKR